MAHLHKQLASKRFLKMTPKQRLKIAMRLRDGADTLTRKQKKELNKRLKERRYRRTSLFEDLAEHNDDDRTKFNEVDIEDEDEAFLKEYGVAWGGDAHTRK